MGEKDLERIIMEMIQEQQMKLGYEKETVRLYFPEISLKRILHLNSEEELKTYLQEFCEEGREKFGEIIISERGGRYCISIPPEGSKYIHENMPNNPFLRDLIDLFRKHNISIEDVKDVFKTYSRNYSCEKQDGIEFDYLLYFQDKQPDPYYYCVKFDEGHASYHRFSEEDLKEIME